MDENWKNKNKIFEQTAFLNSQYGIPFRNNFLHSEKLRPGALTIKAKKEKYYSINKISIINRIHFVHL